MHFFMMCSPNTFSSLRLKVVGGFSWSLPWSEILWLSSELLFVSLYGRGEIAVNSPNLETVHTFIAFSCPVEWLTYLLLESLFLIAYNWWSPMYLFWILLFSCLVCFDDPFMPIRWKEKDTMCLPFLWGVDSFLFAISYLLDWELLSPGTKHTASNKNKHSQRSLLQWKWQAESKTK